jgi:hypothetical protein
MSVLDEQWQQHIANTVSHWCEMARESAREAAAEYVRPSAVFKPRLSIDGDQWCALYGENLQDGVAGFGDSPADAMRDFDRNWAAKLPAKAVSPALDAMMGRKDWPSVIAG